jgi:hypothetical protein
MRVIIDKSMPMSESGGRSSQVTIGIVKSVLTWETEGQSP